MRGLARAARARCPECGERAIWARWGELAERCPGCELVFLREHGYWVGGLIVNLGVAQLAFAVLLLGTVALTWPDVPWTTLLVAAAVLVVALPIWLYPRTKTLWLWVDRTVHPYGRSDGGSSGRSSADG